MKLGIGGKNKQEQEALLRLAAIVESADDAIIGEMLDGTIISWNQGAERIYGYSAAEIIGKPISILIEPDRPDEMPKILDRIKRGQKIDHYETVRVGKGGKQINISLTISPLKDASGKIIGASTIARDITERKRIEEELRVTSLNVRSLIEASFDLLIIISLEGKIMDANEAMVKITGVARKKLIGTDFPDYFIEPAKVSEGYQTVLEKGAVTDYPLTIRHTSGKLTDVSCNASVYKDEAGNVLGVFLAARDISERKQAEEKLKQAVEDLKRSNAELERFAYVASHDLQEPLRMVSSYTQLLEKRYKDKLDADAHDFINYAVDGAKRMQQLINDLLDYSRIGTRGKPLEPTACEAVFKAAVANLDVAIKESKAKVTHDPLPTVMADEGQLVEVFQNLIGNAIKFRGKQPPRVHISAQPDKDKWVFSVKDNGIGIEPQYFDRIFIIFQRLHHELPGTGTGLSIAKIIVERHGGRIWIESQLGKGSTFYFTLQAKGGRQQA